MPHRNVVFKGWIWYYVYCSLSWLWMCSRYAVKHTSQDQNYRLIFKNRNGFNLRPNHQKILTLMDFQISHRYGLYKKLSPWPILLIFLEDTVCIILPYICLIIPVNNCHRTFLLRLECLLNSLPDYHKHSKQWKIKLFKDWICEKFWQFKNSD